MVRTVKNRHEEEEDDDEEFDSRTIDGSSQKVRVDGKTADQKTNTLRSKHSETEQRRRSKINERFQMLRDLIPQNDQKRDKASFLLEVIQYIQFLQEKLNMYEGSYQSWSQEPSKLMPWRNSRGPVESFLDQSQLIKNGFGNEDNIVITPAMLTDAQNSVESDLSAAALYKATDNAPAAATQAIPVNMPLQPNVLLDMPTQPCQGSISDAEHLASQSQAQFWQGRPCTTESAVPSYTLNEQEELKLESGEASISNAYSQGLLNTLTHALQSSGVDLSQASISVQLDIGKRANSGLTATMSNTKDHNNLSPDDQAMAHYGVGSSGEDSDKAHKRLRREQI
ncbi:transcription factor BIM2-like isoform X2 [Cornus florida]|uniref:transcription factor BIM2-like isoform X2 n=2 Tax=Cornus florida TaxID=4283 RepID=UPI00289BD7F4|nr:transcription factor BIM2-like isoform X2 [Cornus florida]